MLRYLNDLVRYTFDQVADSAATAPFPSDADAPRWSAVPNASDVIAGADSAARGHREHSFQLGNDRVTVIGSNYGTYRVRADEGGPKWLNDADPDNSSSVQHGGGFGFL